MAQLTVSRAVYFFAAALEANVLNCRRGRAPAVTIVEYCRPTRLTGRVQGVGRKPDGSEATVISRVAEAEIGGDLRGQVQALLQACFPGYPSRSYFKLPLLTA